MWPISLNRKLTYRRRRLAGIRLQAVALSNGRRTSVTCMNQRAVSFGGFRVGKEVVAPSWTSGKRILGHGYPFGWLPKIASWSLVREARAISCRCTSLAAENQTYGSMV